MVGARFVSSEEGVIKLGEVSRFWEERLKFTGNGFRNIRRERLGERIKCFAEAKELNVECRIRSIDGMSSQKALQRQEVLLWRKLISKCELNS